MRVTWAGLLQAAAVVTVLFSVGTLLPVDHFAVQLFTHFRLQYTVIALLLGIVFVVRHERWYAIVLLGAAAANASLVVPWYGAGTAATGASDFKVVSVNLQASNGIHDKLFALLAAEEPDIVVLQEVTPEWAESLRPVYADYPHRIVEPRVGAFGIGILSKHPLISAIAVDSEPLTLPTLITTVGIRGKEIGLVGTHPMVPLGPRNFDARNAQLEQIGRLLQKMPNPRILVGDMNVSMWDMSYRLLENRTWMRNVRDGFGVLPTWPTFLPFAMIPIDHVLVSEDIGVLDVRTGPRIGSDHLPLIVTLVL
jgi:endonuclease/exonuclease/phosphatase (EEP) superfamily protein YafD